MRRISDLAVIACIGTILSVRAQVPMATSAATLASLSGTYTFQMVQLDDYSVESNMKGQQVGFCNGSVAGYNCWNAETFDLLTGTLVADGAGHITSGNYTMTMDPKQLQVQPQEQSHPPVPGSGSIGPRLLRHHDI
jgi:hypothetical protein